MASVIWLQAKLQFYFKVVTFDLNNVSKDSFLCVKRHRLCFHWGNSLSGDEEIVSACYSNVKKTRTNILKL